LYTPEESERGRAEHCNGDYHVLVWKEISLLREHSYDANGGFSESLEQFG
jgi:hypothetical protein